MRWEELQEAVRERRTRHRAIARNWEFKCCYIHEPPEGEWEAFGAIMTGGGPSIVWKRLKPIGQKAKEK